MAAGQLQLKYRAIVSSGHDDQAGLRARPNRSIGLDFNALDWHATHREAIDGPPAHAERAELGRRSARDGPQQLHRGALQPRVAARCACASLAWSHRARRATII